MNVRKIKITIGLVVNDYYKCMIIVLLLITNIMSLDAFGFGIFFWFKILVYDNGLVQNTKLQPHDWQIFYLPNFVELVDIP